MVAEIGFPIGTEWNEVFDNIKRLVDKMGYKSVAIEKEGGLYNLMVMEGGITRRGAETLKSLKKDLEAGRKVSNKKLIEIINILLEES